MATPQEKKDQIKQRPVLTGGPAPVTIQQPPLVNLGANRPSGIAPAALDAASKLNLPAGPQLTPGTFNEAKHYAPYVVNYPRPAFNGIEQSEAKHYAPYVVNYPRPAFNEAKRVAGDRLGSAADAASPVTDAIQVRDGWNGSKASPVTDAIQGSIKAIGNAPAAYADFRQGNRDALYNAASGIVSPVIGAVADRLGSAADNYGTGAMLNANAHVGFQEGARSRDAELRLQQHGRKVPAESIADAVSGADLTNPFMSTAGGFQKYAGQVADSANMPNAGLAERSGAVVSDLGQGALATAANLATDAVRPLAMAVDPVMDFGRGFFGIKSASAAAAPDQPPIASGTFDSTNMTDAQREAAIAQGEDLDQIVIPQPPGFAKGEPPIDGASATPEQAAAAAADDGRPPNTGSAQAPGSRNAGSYGIDAPPPVGGNVRQGVEIIRGTQRSVADPITGLERLAGVDDMNYLQFGDGAPSRTGDDVNYAIAQEGAALDNDVKRAEANERGANAGALARSNRTPGNGVSASGRVGGGQYDMATKPSVYRDENGATAMTYMDSADQPRKILLPEGVDPGSLKVDYTAGKYDPKTGTVAQSRTILTNKYTGDQIFDSAGKDGKQEGGVVDDGRSPRTDMEQYVEAAAEAYPNESPEVWQEMARNTARKAQQPVQALEDEE